MSNAIRRYSGEFADPISVKVNVITENEIPLSVEPQILNEYKRGEFIQTWNKVYFMTDLSNIDLILDKNKPETFGLTTFSNLIDIPTIEINFTGNTGISTTNIEVDSEHLVTYIDKGINDTFGGVRDESNQYGWYPRSNTELYSFNNKSDIDVFDYPSFSVYNTRKIPSSSDDTLCGDDSVNANKSFYNWYFGENAGINFNPIKTGGTAQSISGNVNTMEGVSTMSNKNGDLLFYSDGLTVFTSGNTEMQNGTGLFGSSSSTQTCLIVPRPSTNKYFVFTTSIENGLRYSVVDMDLQNGEGQVTTKNNTLLLATEKVAATKHSNGIDYWVASHSTGTTTYSVRKIYAEGISSPVITNIGSTHNTAIGYLKFSPNSQKLACAIYDEDIIDIFDFDNSTGTLSNFLTITGFTYINGPYGLEFSEDSSKLYVTDGASTKVYQFDLSYTSATDMTIHAIEVGDVSGGSLGAAQMAPDGKIYIADLDEPYLHVINDTNKLGVECSFKENYFVLSGASSGITSQWGLPNFVSNNYLSPDRDVFYTNVGTSDTFNFDVVFDNLSDVIEVKDLTSQLRLYKYDYVNQVFDSNTVYISEQIPSSGLTKDTYNLQIPFSALTEGEFIFKGFYTRNLNTLLSKQLEYSTTTLKYKLTGDTYGIYDNDWYFINLKRADKPNLKNNVNNRDESSEISTFNVKSRFTTSGITNYTFNLTSEQSLGMVSYNGSVLAKNLDYSANTNSVELLFEVLDNQVLTVSYLGYNGNTTIYNDSYLISESIKSGSTNTQTITDKVFYNTTYGKYEYYLDSEPNTKDVIMVVNGSTLANNIEYYRSTTNNKRIIIDENIKVGDLIEAIYLPKSGILGGIDTNRPIFSWSIGNAPKLPIDGEFTIEITDESDITFENIIYTKTVPYIEDINSYIGQVILSSSNAGDKFRYRIKNEKRYTPISGETITDTIYSDVVTFELTTNIGNSY